MNSTWIALGGISGRELFFVGFFALALAALAAHRRPQVRKAAVVSFLVALLLVNVVGIHALPLTHLHLYSDQAPDVDIRYRLYVVDSDENVLRYDRRAAEPMGDSFRHVIYEMATEYSEERNREIASYLLENARSYRQHVESQRAVPSVFPRSKTHVLDYRWRKEDLATYSPFVGIRIVRITTGYAADGSETVSRDETEMVTIYPGRNRPNASTPPASRE